MAVRSVCVCQTFNFVDMIIDTLFRQPQLSTLDNDVQHSLLRLRVPMSEEEHLSTHCSRVATTLKPLHDGSICLGSRPTGQKASRVL